MSQLSKSLALGFAVAMAGVLSIAISPWIDLEQTFGLPWLYAARGPTKAPDAVVIVAIDEESAEALGVAERPHDWPRGVHAELVRWLAGAGARLIVFDMTFDTPSPQPGQDAALAESMAAAGNVLVSESLRKHTLALDDDGGKPVASVVIERAAPPIPVIARALLGQAPFVVPKAARVDAYWTFRDGAVDAPTLPVLALRSWASAGGSPGAIDQATAAQRERVAASLQSLAAGGGHAYLNLYGPPHTIPTVPYSRVLRAARGLAETGSDAMPGADAFRGKAVFVGYSANSPAGQDRLRDDHRTVYSQDDGMNLSGVELAATAFANLFEDRPLRPLARQWQLGLVAAWGLLLGVLCGTLRPSIAFGVVTLLTAILGWWVLARFTQDVAWWPSVVPIGVQLPLALFCGVWMHYRATKLEREEMRQTFGYYLPRSVVNQLAGRTGSMTQANRIVYGSCLATDVGKYTTLAESMDPARLGRLLNDYYAEMFVPVERSGGIVVDVVGDAMVALWTATSSTVAVRRSACEAALQIVAAVDRFNQASSPDRPALDTRFGLHSGDVMIGNVGASQHYEYRAVGDLINTASRLEGLNKVLGTRLLASTAAIAGLDGLQVRPLGAFRLAGKANEVAVVELLGSEATASPADRRRCAQFAGALATYGAGRWEEAAAEFGSILAEWPDDGPSRFYRDRCVGLIASPPGEGWSPTVTISTK
jgi:adenylate cyclase